MSYSKEFLVAPGSKVRLSAIDPLYKGKPKEQRQRQS